MNLVRYEFANGICKRPHTGIISGLDEAMEGEFINDLSRAWMELCERLPIPSCDFGLYDTISYFKDAGVKEFDPEIKCILKHIRIESMNYVTRHKTIDEDDPDILYQDQYQVVMRR